MKTTTTIAALHALLGPPIGGAALFIVLASVDFVKPPLEGPVPEPMMSIGGLMFLMAGSYIFGTAPAFVTGLLLGQKVSNSGAYSTWNAIWAAVVSSLGCLVLTYLTVAKGRPDCFVNATIISAGVIAAVACRRLLIWSEYIDRR